VKFPAFLASIVFSSSAIAQYTITALPSCDVVIASIGGITDKGAVAWSCYDNPRAMSDLFLLDRSGQSQVGQTETGFLHLNAMNRWGQIVGVVQNGRDIRGLLWSGGVAQELPLLPSMEDGWTVPSGINDRGDIVGGTITPRGDERSFLYRDGVMHDLSEFGRFAHAINNKGEILLEFFPPGFFGLQSGIYKDGDFTPIPTFGQVTVASVINDSGSVAGFYFAPGETEPHAFYYSRTGSADLRRADEVRSRATSINKHDEVVGWWYKIRAGVRGFLYKDGTRFDIQDLLPPNSGWSFTEAHHINDSGQIVGTGLFNNQNRIFLLSPSRSTNQN